MLDCSKLNNETLISQLLQISREFFTEAEKNPESKIGKGLQQHYSLLYGEVLKRLNNSDLDMAIVSNVTKTDTMLEDLESAISIFVDECSYFHYISQDRKLANNFKIYQLNNRIPELEKQLNEIKSAITAILIVKG